MIPHLSSLLEMNRLGEMPMDEIVSHVVKSIALQGEKADYDNLSVELQQAVFNKLRWYQQAGGWFEVSNLGTENFGDYADTCLQKIGNVSAGGESRS